MTTEANIITMPTPDDHNRWADYWFYEVGVNVIPAGFVPVSPGEFKKQPIIDWRNGQINYQENSVQDNYF